MAQNLRNNIDANDTLALYDVNPESAPKIAGPNCVVANSVAEVAEQSDVVVTMLPEPQHVLGVYNEIVTALKASSGAGKLFIDSSTIDVATSLKVGQAVSSVTGCQLVDAPVSGGTLGATNGTLTFMVGADAKSKLFNDTLQPILAHMGKRIVACGGPGLGLTAKLANNYMLALANIATAEGFQIAVSLGLDPHLFSEIVNTSTGRSWSAEVNNPVPGVLPTSPASRDYANGFGLALMRKDLGLAIDAAKQGNVGLLLGEAAYGAYKEVEAAKEPKSGEELYYKNRDMGVVYKYIEDSKN